MRRPTAAEVLDADLTPIGQPYDREALGAVVVGCDRTGDLGAVDRVMFEGEPLGWDDEADEG
jgi:hypothetical protein